MEALDEQLQETLQQLAAKARKVGWLDALIFDDEGGGDGGLETGSGRYRTEGAVTELETGSGQTGGDASSSGAEETGTPAAGGGAGGGTDAPLSLGFELPSSSGGGLCLDTSSRRVRSLESFSRALLSSQLHASKHSLDATMLRTPALPPLLPTDEPPPPDAAERSFDSGSSWVSWAVKGYLGETQWRRRRQSTAAGSSAASAASAAAAASATALNM